MGHGGGTDTATEIGIADHVMVLRSRESILGAGALSWGASLCAGVHSHPHPQQFRCPDQVCGVPLYQWCPWRCSAP